MAPLSKTELLCNVNSFDRDDDDSDSTTSSSTCFVIESDLNPNAKVFESPSIAKRKTGPKRSSLVVNTTHKKFRPSTPRKSVQFASHVEQLTIHNTNDITEHEKLQCWYTPGDYKRIQQDNALTVYKMNGGVFPDNFEETFRGLENHMDDYIVERRYTIESCVDAILRQQSHYFLLDPIWVDHHYALYTARSKMFASRAGHFDARVAMQQA